MSKKGNSVISYLQEYSIPLIVGVIAALFAANLNYDFYYQLTHKSVFGISWFNMHFLVNEIFMVFFFGIAAKEIVESFLPGGALNPVKKAINPLFGTLGGVLGPIAVFFVLTHFFSITELNNGWGIPTATDIALAWLAAKLIFGASHPAINFLLLLAIIDDAIGLGIIAIFYGDPTKPADPSQLLWILLAMAVAYIFRKKNIQSWPLYVFIPGAIAWHGLHAAHLHPALALVPIVPFLPAGSSDEGMFVDEKATDPGHHNSPLEDFEHSLKGFVDFGLFFFAFANAGVQLASVGTITWVILAALIVGKVFGIGFMSWTANKLGFPYPTGMGFKHVVVVGIIAGIGLTVALFVSGAAYTGSLAYAQGPAKMGALFSALGFALAYAAAKLLGVAKSNDN